MKKNIIANLAGRFWSIFSTFAFIPLYIKYLGFESYSVISFTLVIMGIMAVLDSGLTATLSREFARQDSSDEEKFRVFRSLEAGYLFIVFTCIVVIFLASEYIAEHWINVRAFTPGQIALFLKIMSFEIGFQLLLRFYMGGLLGLEKQVEANIYQIGWGILRNGLIIIGIMILPSLLFFFIWQTVSTLIFTLLFKINLQKNISRGNYLSFGFKIEKSVLSKVGNFAGGMMLIAFVSAVNTQLDKLSISKLLSIENLGFYTLAVSLSQGLMVVVNPIATAILPRFTGHYSSGQRLEAKNLFSKFSLLISILVFSIMINMVFFSKDLIWIWTGKYDIAEKTYKLLPIVAFAYGMLAMQGLPYMIAIANGYTKINNILGMISLIITIPGYYFATKNYGVTGAAVVFCLVQTVTTLLYIYFINNKFLKLEFVFELLLKKIVLPLIVATTIAGIFFYFPNYFKENRLLDLFWIGTVTVATLLITTIVFIPIPVIRQQIPKLNKR